MDLNTSLSGDALRAALHEVDAGVFGAALICQSQITSTNDLLRDLASQGAPEGSVVIAEEQTAGRGRMGRTWVAPPGSSLTFTTLFRPILPPDLVYRLVMVCGLAIADAAESIAPVKVDVKWPNDLQIGGKKVAGILPESSMTGDRLDWVLVGTGVNVSQKFEPPDPLAETATSFAAASKTQIDRVKFFAAIMARMNYWHPRLTDNELTAGWRGRCITLGKMIRVDTPYGPVSGLAHDVGASGALHIRDDSGNVHFIHASEATISQ